MNFIKSIQKALIKKVQYSTLEEANRLSDLQQYNVKARFFIL